MLRGRGFGYASVELRLRFCVGALGPFAGGGVQLVMDLDQVDKVHDVAAVLRIAPIGGLALLDLKIFAGAEGKKKTFPNPPSSPSL